MTASRLASRFLSLLLGAALLVSLAGCAAGTLPPVGAAASPALPAAQLLARSAEAFRSMTGPFDIEMTMKGSVSSSGSDAVSLDGVTLSMSFDPTPLAVLVKFHAPGSIDMEMRIVDGVAYLSVPGSLDGWFSVSLDDAAALSGTTPSLGGRGAVPSLDPQVLENVLAGPGLTIEYGPPEQLDGRPMYVVRITATKAWLANFLTTAFEAARQTPAMSTYLDQMTAALPAEIPVTVWIDAQSSLMRRITVSVEVPGGETVGATVDIRSHQGTLDVQPPPADQVKPLTDLLTR